MRFFPICLFCVGCSLSVPDREGPVVDCHTVMCPSHDDLTYMLFRFTEAVPTFDPDVTLYVEWYSPDTDLGAGKPWAVDGHRYTGLTLGPQSVECTSMRAFIHEVMHVHYWRAVPDSFGDANHATQPGPWTEESDATISAVLADAGY